MKLRLPKTRTVLIRIGLITAGATLLYQISDLLLIYKYFRFEYYIAGVALVALTAGIMLRKRPSVGEILFEPVNPLYTLTAKEMQILAQISEGKSNKEIAALHFVEVSTVKTHINNLYGKLGVTNRKMAAELYDKYCEPLKSTLSPPATA